VSKSKAGAKLSGARVVGTSVGISHAAKTIVVRNGRTRRLMAAPLVSREALFPATVAKTSLLPTKLLWTASFVRPCVDPNR
jgi:hypothetical protein